MTRGKGAASLVAAFVAVAGFATPADAQAPAASVNAEGNFINRASLKFNPAAVTVPLGGIVRWTNTDFLVPHTATEDHGLWNLTGSYGMTPFNPAGFGPGESRERPFAAGTWSYFCEVHPVEMHGTVTVSMTATAAKGRIAAVWSTTPLPAGQLFDVQMSKNGGAFTTVRDGTAKLADSIVTLKKKRKKGKGRKGAAVAAKKRKKKFATFTLRARVGAADDATRASGFSPPVSVRSRVR